MGPTTGESAKFWMSVPNELLSQAEKPEDCYQREVAGMSGLPGRSQQGPGCRWVNARVGDSGGTEGPRTCSAGECSSRPSMTQVR